MTDAEPLPQGLFREAIENGGSIEIVLDAEAFDFLARLSEGPMTPRLALAFLTADNENMRSTHKRSLVLTEQMVVKLIVMLQGQLQNIQRHARPGDGDEQR